MGYRTYVLQLLLGIQVHDVLRTNNLIVFTSSLSNTAPFKRSAPGVAARGCPASEHRRRHWDPGMDKQAAAALSDETQDILHTKSRKTLESSILLCTKNIEDGGGVCEYHALYRPASHHYKTHTVGDLRTPTYGPSNYGTSTIGDEDTSWSQDL